MEKNKILIIGADLDVARQMRAGLKQMGYIVTSIVPSGKLAIEEVKNNNPDIVLTDVTLGGEMDGFETANIISSNFDIPVIYITAYNDEATFERAKKTLPSGYLVKPFEMEELKRTVELSLYKHRVEKKERKEFVQKLSNEPLEKAHKSLQRASVDIMEDLREETKQRENTEKELEKVNRSLEKRVVKRTAELTKANKTLQHEISKRKQIEARLKESNNRYHLLIEHIPDVIWTADQDGNTTFISSNLEKVYGYTPEEIYEAGKSLWFGRIHHYDIEHVKEAYKLLFVKNMKYDVEYRIQRKDGKWIWLHDSAMRTYKINGIQYTDGVFFDITEHKQMEIALKKNKEILQSIIDNSTAVIYLKDVQGKYILINSRYEELFNITRKEIVGKTDYDIFPRERADAFLGNDKKVIAAGKPVEFEEVAPHKDELHTYISLKFPLLTQENDIYGICGISTDITERKQRENEMTKYKTLFDNISDLAYICDTEGRVTFVNNVFEELSGHKPEEIFGKTFVHLFDDNNAKKAIDVYTRTLKGESPKYELVFKETGILCEYKNRPLRDEKDNIIGVIGIARNIAKTK